MQQYSVVWCGRVLEIFHQNVFCVILIVLKYSITKIDMTPDMFTLIAFGF